MTDPEKLDLRSHDITEEKRQELLRLFPEIQTEGGKIDFERLKLALGETVDVGKERYGMNWPGKADCFKAIQSPSLGTLRPCPEESINFDTTENFIIEGDNLEVLKLLQKSYLGKIKMIYIDPPYNTGNDFVYPDNYTESLQTYLEYTGQVDSTGKKFSTNTEADGRFHSKWLNMMYPRLYLARNLLREDGLIFISIDDNEVDNLKKVCSEIFGEDNFLAQVTWKCRAGGGSDSRFFATDHEYVLVFSRSTDSLGELVIPFTKEQQSRFDQEDSRGKYYLKTLERPEQLGSRPNLQYPIGAPDRSIIEYKREGVKYTWVVNQDKFHELVKDDRVVFKRSKNSWMPYRKLYLSENESDEKRGTKPRSVFLDAGLTRDGGSDFEYLFEDRNLMPFPKPVNLMEALLLIGFQRNTEGIVLDFFAGSGTTGQAVLELNKKDSGNRKVILVQLPETTGREDYPTIADICKERVRRVIKKLNAEDESKLPLEGTQKQDRGFRVFKLAESNFKAWDANLPTGDVAVLKQQLELHIDHIRDGRTSDDILYEILLKSGFQLTTPVEKLNMEGKTVFSAAGRALFICLERNLTLELIRAMADQKPERVVCLDEGFAGNDQLKANAVQIFKNKGVTSFKTV
ncbi:MAG: site-specific DNA-methyltransferase [Thermodesulfobacteriota bacterium]|nr:site-specific DNA-methyltransferase [Thermodesulfobacteriota bacterium]